MSKAPFQGVLTALVTPFHQDGSLDRAAFRALIESQIAAGVHGLVPCGTTGEAATLTPEEHLEVVRTCVEQVRGRVPVLAGAGAGSTARAIELHQQVAALGVDGALHVTPWYSKPTQEGLYQHFSAVAAASPLPIVLYNVPGRTGTDLLPETVGRLARACPHIVGIKDATGSAARAQELLRETGARRDFALLSGEDAFILPLHAMGGHGVISVISHLCAPALVEMWAACLAGEWERARRIASDLSPLAALLFFRANPIPVKTALAMQGHMHESFRLPLCPLGDDERALLRARLQELGYLARGGETG